MTKPGSLPAPPARGRLSLVPRTLRGWALVLPALLIPAAGVAGEPAGTADAESPAPHTTPGFLANEAPGLDAGGDFVEWNGKSWNITDNRLLEARLEKFLNAPGADPETEARYNKVLEKILELLSPGKTTPRSTDEAYQLLSEASEFDIDARLCDAIANQVYAAWLARKSVDHLAAANQGLEKERKRLEWNSRVLAGGTSLDGGPDAKAPRDDANRKGMQASDKEMEPMAGRINEINTLLQANRAKSELTETQVKVEFQALIVQHFLQRRFQHVVIGTRFYRSIFSDGDSLLRVGREAKSLFSNTSGMPPTIGTLDSLANEAMRDVREGVQAFRFLLQKNELAGATKRLAETFIIGEYQPEIRTLPREDKRRALLFVQQSNQLANAIEVRDYALAESLLKQLEKSAVDFDRSKPMAAVETARTVAGMHLAKARSAASSGDKATLEAELREATEIWPRNPALAEVGGTIFNQSDVMNRAISDFDQLVSQKNYRQIYDDKMRFIAATAMFPEKQEQLKKVLEDMAAIDAFIIRAQEVEKRGNFAGAWESAESASRQFPDDNKLNQVRADLTTKASDFVRAIRQAEELESRDQIGSSLAWYLKAQKSYPASEFARLGIERINARILPDLK